MGAADMATPSAAEIALRAAQMTPEQYNMLKWEREIEERNKPLSNEDLDAMFPMEGYLTITVLTKKLLSFIRR